MLKIYEYSCFKLDYGRSRDNNVSEISKLNFQIYHFVLTCDKEVLTERWHSDNVADWRTDDNLNKSIGILSEFNKRTDCIFIDTSDLSVDMAAHEIIERVRAK